MEVGDAAEINNRTWSDTCGLGGKMKKKLLDSEMMYEEETM